MANVRTVAWYLDESGMPLRGAGKEPAKAILAIVVDQLYIWGCVQQINSFCKASQSFRVCFGRCKGNLNACFLLADFSRSGNLHIVICTTPKGGLQNPYHR